jgi:hypothetical protein
VLQQNVPRDDQNLTGSQSFFTIGLVAFDALEEAGDGKDARLYVRREAFRYDAKLLILIGICFSRARSY